MPERYNFVTENIDDFKKATAVVGQLGDFCINVMVHRFERIGARMVDDKCEKTVSVSYFITGQSIEIDSNAGCFELRNCLQDANVAAVFINDPTQTGAINCGCKNFGV